MVKGFTEFIGIVTMRQCISSEDFLLANSDAIIGIVLYLFVFVFVFVFVLYCIVLIATHNLAYGKHHTNLYWRVAFNSQLCVTEQHNSEELLSTFSL